jgi:hypothetical protein
VRETLHTYETMGRRRLFPLPHRWTGEANAEWLLGIRPCKEVGRKVVTGPLPFVLPETD